MKKLTKTEQDIVTYMHTRWPDKGTKKEKTANLYFRMGFYECWHFVNGQWDNEQKEKKEIAAMIYKKLTENMAKK
jgi:hypothetical protein